MCQIINTYINGFITMIGALIFGKVILNINIGIKFRKSVLIFIFTTLIYTFIHLTFENTMKTVLILLIDFIAFKFIFGTSSFKSILLVMLYSLVLMITDVIVLFVFTVVLGVDKIYFYENLAGGLIGNLIVYLLFLLITYIFRVPLRNIINYKIENKMKIIIFSGLTLLCIFAFFYSLINAYKKSDDVISYIVIMVLSIVMLVNSIKQIIDNQKLARQYDKLLDFMNTYEEEVEKQRTIRHENKNVLLKIKAMAIDKCSNKEIVKYVNGILKDDTSVKFAEYAKFHNLPSNGIKGMCYLKVSEAENKHIVVGVVISEMISTSNIYNLSSVEEKEFGKILGVLFDNAIEASEVCEKKQIGIEAYNRNGNFKMIISNTFDNDVDLLVLGKEKYTTKGSNHGRGLLLVQHIIDKYPIFELCTEIRGELFIQNIVIKKPIK